MNIPIRTPNLLAAAIKAQTIDEAIKPIQDALGIVSGDLAKESLSTYSDEEWESMNSQSRAWLISDWLCDELDVARRRMS